MLKSSEPHVGYSESSFEIRIARIYGMRYPYTLQGEFFKLIFLNFS